MRSILITGCSSGIGLDAAITLHQKGWQVLATCRQETDCERLKLQGLESFVLDYADSASVVAGAERALEITDGQLEAVFNNGAFGIPGLVEDLPRGALQSIFETNLFGQIELSNCLLSAMNQLDRAYMVFNSSVLGFAGMPYRGAYCATKFALEGIVDTLRMEQRHTNLNIVLIEPGPITSRIRQNSIAHFEHWIKPENSQQATRYQEELLPRLYDNTEKPDRFELPASAVTNKLLRILDNPKPRPRHYVTVPTYLAGTAKRFLSSRFYDSFLSIK